MVVSLNCLKFIILVVIVVMVFFFFLSVATFQFQFNQYFVNETDDSVRVAVILTGAVDESVTVRYDIYQLLK